MRFKNNIVKKLNVVKATPIDVPIIEYRTSSVCFLKFLYIIVPTNAKTAQIILPTIPIIISRPIPLSSIFAYHLIGYHALLFTQSLPLYHPLCTGGTLFKWPVIFKLYMPFTGTTVHSKLFNTYSSFPTITQLNVETSLLWFKLRKPG